MQSTRARWIAIAALLAHGTANADSDAQAPAIVAALVAAFYVGLCFFSIPFSLLLRGSILKRIALGLAAPLVGMVLAYLASWTLQRLRLIAEQETDLVFIGVSVLPIMILLMWGIAERVNDL